jgi:hypothetical protein
VVYGDPGYPARVYRYNTMIKVAHIHNGAESYHVRYTYHVIKIFELYDEDPELKA